MKYTYVSIYYEFYLICFCSLQEKFPRFDFKHYGHQSMMSFSRQLPEVFLGTRDKKNGEFMLFPSQQDDSSDDEKPTALGKLKC